MTHNWAFWMLLLIGAFGLWRRRKNEGETPMYYICLGLLGFSLACAIALSIAG